MTKRTLADLKSIFGSSDKEGGNKDFGPSLFYPFWNMKTGQITKVRFLPDLNENNPRGFLVEQVFHNLTLNGKPRKVPCLSMYDEPCPVCKLSQEYYKVKDEVNGKKYWRKKQYIAQALIVEDPLPPDAVTGELHQGHVRYISLGYQLYNIIKEAFSSTEDPLDGIPYDFKDGYDFIIKRTDQGQYASYTTGTKFHSKQRALTEDELHEAGEHMIDIATLLPKNPGEAKVQAMLDADINGGEYSDGNDKGPGGANESFDNMPKSSPPASAKPATTTPATETPTAAETPASSSVATPAAEDEDVDEMLATIRARRKAKAAETAPE